MNKELRKYIKNNFKKYKKRKSIIKILLSPITFILSFSNKSYNKIFFEDELVEFEEKKQSNSGKILHKLKSASIEEDNTNEINDESNNNDDDSVFEFDIPAFLRNKKDIDIDQYIEENNKYNDFQTLLFKMIDERNLIDADVYNKVHIDRRLFSKIRNDKNYHPSKETIILLGLSMELSEDELEKLLDSASYSLPRNNHYDLIIRFCFMKGIYKITEVNDLLEQYNCKLFNY